MAGLWRCLDKLATLFRGDGGNAFMVFPSRGGAHSQRAHCTAWHCCAETRQKNPAVSEGEPSSVQRASANKLVRLTEVLGSDPRGVAASGNGVNGVTQHA